MAWQRKSTSNGEFSFVVNTQAEVAHVYAVSRKTISAWISEGMPGENGAYDVHRISAWLRTSGPWCPRALKAAKSDDPLLDQGDSPGLERYRLAKAAIAELDLDERRGGLMAIGKVRTALGRWSAIIRHLGERLAKRYGNDAATALNDALAECHRVIGYEFCSGSSRETTDRDAGVVSEAGSSTDHEDDEPVGGG